MARFQPIQYIEGVYPLDKDDPDSDWYFIARRIPLKRVRGTYVPKVRRTWRDWILLFAPIYESHEWIEISAGYTQLARERLLQRD